MVNENIQGPVGLIGRGLVSKPLGNYETGEYEKLTNAEITTDSTVRSRRSITKCDDFLTLGATAGNAGTKIQRFAGYLYNFPVYLRDKSLYLLDVDNDFKSYCLVPSPYTAPAKRPDIIAPRFENEIKSAFWVAAHSYQGKAYYIQAEYTSYVDINAPTSAEKSKVGLRYVVFDKLLEKPVYLEVQPNTVVATPISNNTKYDEMVFKSSTYTKDNPDSADIANNFDKLPGYVTSFVFKDRLWIASTDSISFTKATDFGVWEAPDGGFFNFEDEQINDVVALRDSVYIICDSNIYVLTYTSDPNQDSAIVKVSGGMGGDAACVYNDTILCYKGDRIFSVSQNNVSLVMDLKLNLGDYTFDIADPVGTTYLDEAYWKWMPKYKLQAFGEYIIVIKRWESSYHYTGKTETFSYNYSAMADKYYAGNQQECLVFFINMDNGAVHQVEYRDMMASDYFTGAYATITDVMLPQWENKNDRYRLYFMTHDILQPVGYVSSSGGISYMDYEEVTEGQVDFVDSAYKQDGSVVWYSAPIDIKIDSYTPDGSEYYVKKFRHLMLQAKLSLGLMLRYRFSNSLVYTEEMPLARTTTDANMRPHVGVRYPINQRGTSISFNIYDPTVPLLTAKPTDNNEYSFEISDMRVLWTYTARGPKSRGY